MGKTVPQGTGTVFYSTWVSRNKRPSSQYKQNTRRTFVFFDEQVGLN